MVVVGILLRSCVEKHYHGPYNYCSVFKRASSNIQVFGGKALFRKNIIGQRDAYFYPVAQLYH